MIIPKEIKVGGLIYKVEHTIEPSDTNSNVDGRIIYDKQVIKIKHDNGTDYSKMVFLHEVIHAIFDFCNLEQDEDKIERLTKALHMVMKDNPDFFRKREGEVW